MLDCHINAFLIKPGRVMGRKLRPLTLAHLWILEAVDSPYAYNAPATYTDTAFAVFIVSLPASIGRWLIMHPAAMRRAFALWGRLHRAGDPQDEVEAFGAYWKAYTAMPDRWPSTAGKSRPSCLPSSVNIAWSIMGKIGEKAAWSMPLPRALMYLVAEGEVNGAEYKTESQIQMARLNAEMEGLNNG